MDQLVFEEFIKKRSRGLVDVMENGILRGGVDWLNAGKPTGESRARASGASASKACSLERVLCRYVDEEEGEGLNGLEEEGREEREEANNQRSDPICTKRS
jgi:hypothetical protein